MEPALISAEGITIRQYDRFILHNTDWKIRKGEQWGVVGPNGSGKSSLIHALAGEIPVVRGRIVRHAQIGYVSDELQRQVLAKERRADVARYYSREVAGTRLRDFLLHAVSSDDRTLLADLRCHFENLVRVFYLESLLERGIRDLSTGELRRALLARALLRKPQVLMLDETYDGLDPQSRSQVARMIENLIDSGTTIVLATHHLEELDERFTHILRLEECAVVGCGTRHEILDNQPQDDQRHDGAHERPVLGRKTGTTGPETVVEMRNVTVGYGDVLVFERLTWRMNRGENWLICGPNGCGKTTFLKLIAGDHTQAYANDILLFGRRRGSGETVWQIKKQIGLVSTELQFSYHREVTAFEVVMSGFFDSVGLYRNPTTQQRMIATEWIEKLEIKERARCTFTRLSFGEQRLLLIARAMVKSPSLLILDEPCQGLDRSNRQNILNLVDYVGLRTSADILYVTHRADEVPVCTTRTLDLGALVSNHTA